jgi:hypothetical protein
LSGYPLMGVIFLCRMLHKRSKWAQKVTKKVKK